MTMSSGDNNESRKRRLMQLTRALRKGDVPSAQSFLQSHGHSGVNRKGTAQAIGPVGLVEACGGNEESVETPAGPCKFHLIRRTLTEVSSDEAHIATEFANVMKGAREQFDELAASAELCHVAGAQSQDLLFMDTETCGLGGMPIFLVGVMLYRNGDLVFEQYFARNYAEEPAILQAFLNRLKEAKVLVTFNGKSFDMNMIRDRCAFYGMDVPAKDGPPENRMPPHLDLLHESRRRWRGKLPNCKLQTLEQFLCHRHRAGDIPGSAIPDAYHRFVNTSNARQVRDILHHNLLDMLTMAQLITILLTGCEAVD